MKLPATADVVVVGAGPAGSVTAALLARRGHDVVLLDRASFPRPKPCGESLNPGAVHELAAIGALDDVVAAPHATVRRWRIHPQRGAPFEGGFTKGIHGIAIDRSGFDTILVGLARRAGAQVVAGARVVDLVRRDGAVTGVRTADGREIRARAVVGADGLRSVVVRRLGLLRRGPRLRKLALTAHVRGADLPDATGLLCLTDHGCIGIAPLGDGTCNVVVVLHGEAARLARGNPDGCFDRLIASNRYLRRAMRFAGVQATGPFDWPTRAVAADGAILVGDAAGYFDPLTGQGIYRAIRGARMAAEVLDPLLAELRVSADHPSDRWEVVPAKRLARYQTLHDTAFRSGARMQRLIEFGVAHPPLFSAAAAVLRTSPRLADRILAITGDVAAVRRMEDTADAFSTNAWAPVETKA